MGKLDVAPLGDEQKLLTPWQCHAMDAKDLLDSWSANGFESEGGSS